MRSDISERWAAYLFSFEKKAVSQRYKLGITFEHPAILLSLKPMEFLNG